MRRLWQRLKIWSNARRQYGDLAEEMQLHMELRARALRESGYGEAEAAALARKRFGNTLLIREDAREVWAARWLDELRRDVSYALRSLRHNWVFTTAALATLTLGIAANTAVFAFIDTLVLRSLNTPHPEQLVALTVHDWAPGVDEPYFSYPAFRAIASRVHSIDGLFTWNESQFSLGWGTNSHTLSGAVASGNYYQTMARDPLLGRFFGPRDDTPSAPATAVLSYRL